MNQDLQESLAHNAQQWLALSLAISSAEKLAFNKLHDELYTAHGPVLMAQVYRDTFEHTLQSMPEAERTKLLAAFKQAISHALHQHHANLKP